VASDPYLARVNRALKDLGCSVSLEVSPSGRSQRISTHLPYPSGLDQATQLGSALQLHRRRLDPFPFERWGANGLGVQARTDG
jgi:hypothetical protein